LPLERVVNQYIEKLKDHVIAEYNKFQAVQLRSFTFSSIIDRTLVCELPTQKLQYPDPTVIKLCSAIEFPEQKCADNLLVLLIELKRRVQELNNFKQLTHETMQAAKAQDQYKKWSNPQILSELQQRHKQYEGEIAAWVAVLQKANEDSKSAIKEVGELNELIADWWNQPAQFLIHQDST